MELGRLYVPFKHEKSAWDILRGAIYQLFGKVGAIFGGDIYFVENFFHRFWNNTIKSRTMKYDELRGVETQATLETKFGT